jgi:hypothetical protein
MNQERAYHASPAKALIRASRNSRMPVVGSRGLGGISEMVLGSVSDQCVRHAHCRYSWPGGPKTKSPPAATIDG